ncbi:MAG TPA: hypothetical protein VH988_30020 [Thermoanaerobaculia bacterium]|jgi:hypothetical protein|nr:hypothetical protein [Thermoanaerobaculia bacterium]
MGTFHQGMSEWHGITVVVDTDGPEVFVGRCHDVNDQGVFLHDVDFHCDGDNGRSKEDYVKRAAQLGVWKKHDHLRIPNERVVSIRRLGEF